MKGFRFWGKPYATAALTLIMTLLGEVVLHVLDVPPPVHLIIISAVFATLIILTAAATLAEVWSRLNEERAAKDDMEALQQSLPMMVRFKRRADTMTIQDHEGTALIHYDVDLESPSEDDITKLDWPIVVDLDKGGADYGKRVELKSLKLNDIVRSTVHRYHPRQQRSGTDSDPPKEYGVLTLPVELQKGVSTCNLKFELELKKVFGNASKESGVKEDYLIVDIPYVTDNLHVEINIAPAAGKSVQPAHRPSPIDAGSLAMETSDLGETYRQGQTLKAIDQKISWKTSFPKLGYRYKVWFYIIE